VRIKNEEISNSIIDKDWENNSFVNNKIKNNDEKQEAKTGLL
jgi:hypothetical protein